MSTSRRVPRAWTRCRTTEVLAMLRGMVKSRRESVELYRQGNRPELADKGGGRDRGDRELSSGADGCGRAWMKAVADAVAETGAGSLKDMGTGHGGVEGASMAQSLDHGPCRAIGPQQARRLMGPAWQASCRPAFLEELRARTPIAAVIGAQGQTDAVGPPHSKAAARSTARRSPSFYVYEDHFHCFRLRRAWRCHQFRHAEHRRRRSWRRSASWPARPGWTCRRRVRSRRPPSGGGLIWHEVRGPRQRRPVQRRLWSPRRGSAAWRICAAAGCRTRPSVRLASAGRGPGAARWWRSSLARGGRRRSMLAAGGAAARHPGRFSAASCSSIA